MSVNSSPSGRPLSPGGRAGLVVFSLVLLAGFGVARGLEPDPRGFGTHQRLGLPECTFQLLWNRPCPGCGMTTSFANLTRGRWQAALRANPAGVFLAVCCALLIPWLWGSAWRGETVGLYEPMSALVYLIIALAGVTAIVWLCRLCF